MKQKHTRGSIGEKPKNSKDISSDLTGNGTYSGSIPTIVGRQRLLVIADKKESFIYVNQKDVEAIKAKYGKDFIRDCGVVTTDPRPVNNGKGSRYLV